MSETSEKVNVLNDAEKDVIVRYRNVKKHLEIRLF